MPEGGKSHARNPSWDLRSIPRPEDKPDNLGQPRLSRSMPSLGAMMHPEIGLAGSLAGEGKFRRQFERAKRESSNSGSWPSAENFRDSALRREFSGQLEGLRSSLAETSLAETSLDSARNSFDEAIDDAPSVGSTGAVAAARDRTATAGDASSAPAPAVEPSTSCGPGTDTSVSPPNRRKFVVNAAASADGADARRKANVKGRFVIKERQEQGASLWGFDGQAPADPRQGTLVSRAPRKASRKFEITGASACTSRPPSAAAGAAQPQCAPPAGVGRQGSPHCWAQPSERGAVSGAPAAPVGARRQGAAGAHANDRRASTSKLDNLLDVPGESGLALLCEGAKANRALFTSWADPCAGADASGGRTSPVASPRPIEMMVALLEAQRDLLDVENAALRQLNTSLKHHIAQRAAAGTGARVVT